MAVIGREEKDYGLIEDKDFIQRIMSTLNEQEKKVITERFYKGRSQEKFQKKWEFPRCMYLEWNAEFLRDFADN